MKSPLSLVIIFSTLAFAFPLKAQDQPSPANIALATELVEVMQMERGLSPGIDAVKQMQVKLADSASTNSSPDTKEILKKVVDFGGMTAVSVMSWEKQKPLFISAYASVYTAEELKGAIDFYKSPVGQKWVEKQPQISSAIVAKSTEKVMASQQKMMDSIKKSMGALDAIGKGISSSLSNLPTLPPPAPASSPTN